MKPKATALAVLTAAFVLVALPSAAQPPPPPPGLPDDLDDLLPKSDPIERFKVTVEGSQESGINFSYDQAPGQPCGPRSNGFLDESWFYNRGTKLVMEFRLVAGRHLLLRRVGRPLGDAAFTAPGTLERDAGGTFDSIGPTGPTGCVSFPLRTTDCGRRFEPRAGLRLGWSKGKLTLQHSGPAAQNRNPAESCGMLAGGAYNFNEFSYPYPLLGKQKGKLPLDKIFGSKPGFRVKVKHAFLEPGDPPAGYVSLRESMSGSSTVTFKRLKD